MHKATAVLAREVGWRLQAVLRPRRFFTRAQLFGLYKCQVLSYVESGIAYYHAAPSLLHRIDLAIPLSWPSLHEWPVEMVN